VILTFALHSSISIMLTYIGLNKNTVQDLAKATGNKRFAYDSYRRLLDMFGDFVLGIPHKAFEEKLEALKTKNGVTNDVDLNADSLAELCEAYFQVYQDHQEEFPQDPSGQIKACVKAVCYSNPHCSLISSRKFYVRSTCKKPTCRPFFFPKETLLEKI